MLLGRPGLFFRDAGAVRVDHAGRRGPDIGRGLSIRPMTAGPAAGQEFCLLRCAAAGKGC